MTVWALAGIGLSSRAAGPLLLITAFLLGLRHGIDWDHIAAIADLTSSQRRPRSGMLLGAMYAGGHSLMLLGIGGIAVLIGARLPGAVERVTGPLVGITLLALGLVILASLLRSRGAFRLRSRWMMVIYGALRAYDWVRERMFRRVHVHREWSDVYSYRAAFAMGMLHGVGAETPTQVLLFATAAELGGRGGGLVVLLCFVLGLLCSNSGLSVASTLGFMRAADSQWLGMILGGITGVFSVGIGALFLTGHSSILPALFGG
jgi:high-affinity nickel permease